MGPSKFGIGGQSPRESLDPRSLEQGVAERRGRRQLTHRKRTLEPTLLRAALSQRLHQASFPSLQVHFAGFPLERRLDRGARGEGLAGEMAVLDRMRRGERVTDDFLKYNRR